MKHYHDSNGTIIYHGDCREVMPQLEPVDAIMTDPPYALEFMGKGWDKVIPGIPIWKEALRVLKPGGHLLAFGGTRTFHRLTCAIEDAGFEIRDCVMWLYGSGFPKSLDVGKAIDKAGGDALAYCMFAKAYKTAVESSSFSHSDIDRHLGIKSSSCYWAREDHRGGMPPRPHWEKVRLMLKLDPTFERLYDEAEREVLALHPQPATPRKGTFNASFGEAYLTAPATDAAKQWDGWGTALKPAWEPIILARKPLDGTVAENVQKHGVGGLNVDGCRVGTDEHGQRNHGGKVYENVAEGYKRPNKSSYTHKTDWEMQPQGRWPANVIHDGSEEVVGEFPRAGSLRIRIEQNSGRADESQYRMKPTPGTIKDFGDSGSAARFFYCAKASKGERNAGCDGLPLLEKPLMGEFKDNPGRTTPKSSPTPRANYHPTVKPVALMRYLCRLITPPNGIILDPFMGSGSTLIAAQHEGFRIIGIEIDEGYCEIAAKRITQEAPQSCLL